MFAYFVDRPILAGAISFLITLIGAVAGLSLPTAQFPQISPPIITVEATYPGASAQQAYEAIAIPLEQEINGAQDLIYIYSFSNTDGSVVLYATFAVGSDLSAAAADVLTRANRAEARLPQAVRDQGLQITKSSRQQLGTVALYSEDGQYDELFLSNWAETQVIKPLRRVEGMGRIVNLSNKRYAMRVWLDPAKMEALGIGPQAVVDAVRQQNAQITTGTLGKPPMEDAPPLELQIVTKGRLVETSEFENIVLRANPGGSVVRIRDVARVELGSEQYGVRSSFDNKPSAALRLYQNPQANAVEVMQGVRTTMKELAKRFPPGLKYEIALDRTEFVKEAIREVYKTLLEAIVLVVAVTYLFLQNWRATLIPAIAVPVALVGTFGPMAVLGFSLNTLSLLGLVLAVGLVVDDAIIVVENTERLMGEGRTPREAAREAVTEVAGPVIATTLVLAALFVPVAFIPGLTGQLYNQFALTIAISVGISGIVSLTLTPALCGLLLRKHRETRRRWWRAPLRWFDAALQRGADGVVIAIGALSRHLVITGLVFLGFAAGTYWLVSQRPAAFVPQEDQGYFFADIAMPKGASVERTAALVKELGAFVREQPGVANTLGVVGRGILSESIAPFYGFQIPALKPWSEREESADQVIAAIKAKFKNHPDGEIRIVDPSPLPGLGSRGGLTVELQDRSGAGGIKLAQAADRFVAELQKLPEIGSAVPITSYGVPQVRLDIDRAKAEQLGVPLPRLFDALGTYVGSSFVNLFNRFGFVYQVYVQSEASGRRSIEDLERLTVLNSQGEPVRIGSLVTPRFVSGPTAVLSYNTYPAVEIAVETAETSSSGSAIAAVEGLAGKTLGNDYAIEWTEVAYQQKLAGGYAPLIFGLGVLMVFVLLAGQYESLRLPFVVILATPLAIFGAVGSLALRNLPLDIFGQIGLLLLVGLAAKNSILLVSFAEEARATGVDALKAAQDAARLRIRPILMTAFAFILGSVPLAIASGAGANARISIGTVVIGGLFVATILTLFVTPVFYVAAERVRWRGKDRDERRPDAEDGGAALPAE
ncbi:efflux RND transporter permease subunit [Microbacterium sp. ARD31]|uniref:efflux RND transporter permease subunit n=1 Tax=Methylobacterium fujisawaense TaxID=107400 RepID=UPI002882057E|nr:efflux RND transporter permease subunit [Microbacterium sp. ARD31]MDT0187985.1 efflux RND transporter permease subunit [Microbacterium sp. ARD31]MDV2987897.1 efflux RND transporter permease subunit [Methylobacteriaceae bacterium AG10]